MGGAAPNQRWGGGWILERRRFLRLRPSRIALRALSYLTVGEAARPSARSLRRRPLAGRVGCCGRSCRQTLAGYAMTSGAGPSASPASPDPHLIRATARLTGDRKRSLPRPPA